MLNEIIQASSSIGDGDALPSHPNRVIQADVDGIVYHTADMSKSLTSNLKGTLNYLEWLREVCGATYISAHTTMHLKGGRTEMAHYYPYQKERGNGMNPDLRKRVKELRLELHNLSNQTVYACPQWYVEADDSMTRMHNELIAKTGDSLMSVIASGDKDLRMNGGIFFDLNTKKFSNQGYWDNGWQDIFGKAEYIRPTGKGGKLSGRGTAIFWAQMLGGDTADTIKGVPYAYQYQLDMYDPLSSNKPRANNARKAFGMSLACKVLSHFNSDKAAYNAVAAAYRAHFGNDWKFFFFENAFLLWMRRTNDTLDVLQFLQPLGFDYELHSQQKRALQEYYDKCLQFNKQNGIG